LPVVKTELAVQRDQSPPLKSSGQGNAKWVALMLSAAVAVVDGVAVALMLSAAVAVVEPVPVATMSSDAVAVRSAGRRSSSAGIGRDRPSRIGLPRHPGAYSEYQSEA
jgi:hypothetical protein